MIQPKKDVPSDLLALHSTRTAPQSALTIWLDHLGGGRLRDVLEVFEDEVPAYSSALSVGYIAKLFEALSPVLIIAGSRIDRM